MKNFLIVIFVTLSVISCKKDNTGNNVKHCFYSDIDNSKLILDAVIDNDKISGNYDYIINDKIISNGIFSGNIKDSVAMTICEFTQNGKKQKEEFIFKIHKDKVSILGGEKKQIDGVWRFINKDKGVYMNDIPRRNCN